MADNPRSQCNSAHVAASNTPQHPIPGNWPPPTVLLAGCRPHGSEANTRDVWLTPAELAARLKLPVKTLAAWRAMGRGPQSARMGKHRRYLTAYVVVWERDLPFNSAVLSAPAPSREWLDSEIWLTPDELAARLKLPKKTLAVWRSTGQGPRYATAGRHCRYLLSDVTAWERSLFAESDR
ncbi:helix-turn-helix domain-containing protein [Nocardia tengchongensis]